MTQLLLALRWPRETPVVPRGLPVVLPHVNLPWATVGVPCSSIGPPVLLRGPAVRLPWTVLGCWMIGGCGGVMMGDDLGSLGSC